MEKKQNLSVVMLPWLAHGHISPYLELAKRLSKRSFKIYLCSTPINLTSINKNLVHNYSIELIEFEIPSQPDLPPHFHTTNRLPLHLHNSLITAVAMASPTFSNLIKTLKPDILIYDFNQQWSSTLAAALNIPSVQFITGSPIFFSHVIHRLKKPTEDFPYPALNLPGIYWNRKFLEMFKQHKNVSSSNSVMGRPCGIMFMKSSFEEVERKYIEYGSELFGVKIVPTGPLIKDPEEDDDIESEIMEWLNRKQISSTVFVSFGTENFLSREEIEEIAKGLELSMVNFIWVLRFPFGEKISIEEALPIGFLERVNTESDRRLVIDKWVSQSRILAHPSIGGFVSHCGWGSTTEAMAFGVPIVAIPMQLDQPLNARLVNEVGVGVEVERDENGKFSGEEIAKLIRDVVLGENGKNIRDKAVEMKGRMKIEGEDAIDGVVEELYKLHHKNVCISGENN
ncbi:beta-D-glucosyl crocetin beta-1,6-glucosyltransferase-like isoform X1 [Impatiens glandulifera]|uniref:beta-D-glucosyl crocetin beta-1,6-glucosyltransferase-like isoform X1 n=1 Tax=Impatiens glandulifera TaxID=253017 RepID=UPI001FB11B90|nr:beta-D-glucosyl crocetin beta-1,6-glucosyltransferase-like isoform X1 [Impatiens glandulifera]